MPSTIILVPDIYFRNWDERTGGTSGEMWLCLRPMIATGRIDDGHPLGDKLEDFLAWTADPHGVRTAGAKRYDVKSPHELGLGTKVCGSDDAYMPINLPSDLDVHIRIGRRAPDGTERPEQLIDLVRTASCRASSGAKEGEDALGPLGAAPDPFARMFNEQVRKQFEPLLAATPRDQGAIHQASFAFLQQMEAGRRIRFTPGQVKDPYTKTGTQRPVLESNPADGQVTTVYWFLGLMVRLGTQSDLASLHEIDRVDIALRDGGADDYALIPFPDTQGGTEDAHDYFQRVGAGFAHTLTTELLGREEVVYVGPGFRSFRHLDAPPDAEGASIWTVEASGPQQKQSDNATGSHGGLSRLGAIEVRGRLVPGPTTRSDGAGVPRELTGIGSDIKVVPGLYVSGTLKRYRRFPNVEGKATEALRTTVLTFEPDPATAAELAKLRDGLGDDGLRPLLSAVVNGWTLTLLHGGVLPWDGPNPIYRMVAEPGPKASRQGASLMCPETAASFFLPATETPLQTEQVGERHLWRSTRWGVASAQALADRWLTEAGSAWQDVRINALKITGVAAAALDQANAHVMIVDEFDLLAAESPVRLEKVLAVTALSPRMQALAGLPATDLRNFDPLRDYEDDFVNFNTVRMWRNRGGTGSREQVEESRLRSPQQSEADPVQCRVGGAQRRQTVPLLHSWPLEPLDTRPADKPTTVTWQLVRDEIARRHDLIAEIDAPPYTLDLEHTYGDRRPVMDGNGASVRVSRSARRSWPVQLPTFIDRQDASPSGPGSQPFVRCSFVPGASGDSVELVFDLALLTFQPMTADDARSDQSYTHAVAAWRSVAELASPGAVLELVVRPATFQLLHGVEQAGVDPAQTAAERGYRGGWAGGVVENTSVKVTGGADLAAIAAWASGLITGSMRTGRFSVRLPNDRRLGAEANLLRIDLRLTRNPAQAPLPKAALTLTPISQQPGLFSLNADSMQGVWGELGFGPTLKALDQTAAGPLWPQLEQARAGWAQERTSYADAVTPVAPQAPSPPPAGPANPGPAGQWTTRGQVQAALASALDGSDWFAPAGPGPRTARLSVRPIVVPVGFAPCRPHLLLKQATQTALERVMIGLRDAIDLAYEDWSTLGAQQWRTRFAAIASLADTGGSGRAAGLLTRLADALTERLLLAEPDPTNRGNQAEVRAVASALGPTSAQAKGDLRWFRAGIRRRLLNDPGLFADAKALLLTAIDFQNDPAASATPPADALARLRFHRLGVAQDGQPDPSQPAASTVTVDDLALTGTSPQPGTQDRLGFVEALADARYGDRFTLPTGSPEGEYAADSFESLVDPDSAGAEWRRLPAVLPLAAANDGRAGRVVHLASRALVSPPVLRWTGESEPLDDALDAGVGTWTVENLEQGKPGAPAGGGTTLAMLASYRKQGLAQSIEQGISFALYRVSGDEEAASAAARAFDNDGFYLRLQQSDYARCVQPARVVSPSATLPSEPLLRQLLFAGVGSEEAGEAIRRLALAGEDHSAELDGLIATGDAPPPSDDHALIRLVSPGTGRLEVLGTNAQATIGLIKHAALLAQPNTGDGARTAYFLIGFETTVWAPVEAELLQGRNIADDRWSGSDSRPDYPRFAPQFWQSAAQDAPASRHLLQQRARQNSPAHWRRRPTHVVQLDASWRGPQPPRRLLEKLLFEAGHAVGDGQTTASILSASSKSRIFEQELSIQVFQEQFGEEPTASAEPLGNFPIEANALIPRRPGVEPGPVEWFDRLYSQFSVSLRWFAPSGTVLLTLDRMFVEFVSGA